MALNIRSSYKPPNFHEVGDKLLDKVHEFMMGIHENSLRGQTDCAAMDGWSNVHNEQIVKIIEGNWRRVHFNMGLISTAYISIYWD